MFDRYIVRDAIDREVFTLVELSERVMLESTYKHMNFSKEKVANYLYGAIIKRPGWFLRVIAKEDSNEIAGGLLCTCETTLFGSDKIAHDVTIMVTEENRGRCLKQLIQIIYEYKEWALDNGAKMIKLGVSSGMNIDKASTFYEKLGFQRVGAMHAFIVNESEVGE